MPAEVRIVTASQIVSFDRDDAVDRGILRLEVDARADGLNGGKTSFSPGDSVGLLLYRSPNITLLHGPIVTYGAITPEGMHEIEQSGFLAYAGDTNQAMSYPICNPEVGWIGNDLGPVSVVHCTTVELDDPPDWNPSDPDVPLADKIGILRYRGISVAAGYRLTGTLIPDEEVPYQIGIYVFGAENLP